MKSEFSAGALIFRREKNRALFLLIYSGRNKIWGFPKGHVEEGESEKAAALREIKEETGIVDLRFVEDFREEDVYQTVREISGSDLDTRHCYVKCQAFIKNSYLIRSSGDTKLNYCRIEKYH